MNFVQESFSTQGYSLGSTGGYSSSVSFNSGAAAGSSSVNQIAQDLLQFSSSSSGFGASSSGASAGGSFGASSGAGGSFGFGGASGSSFSGALAGAGGAGTAAGAGFGAGAAAAGAAFVSQVEAAILAAQGAPININETEEITVLGNKGIWANKAEVVNWRGAIPIDQYAINDDANPEVITKRGTQQLEYIQELAIRYLRPPTPPAPGEIVIKQEGNSVVAPAPPLVIRQVPARAATPEPLVVREAPPQAPQPVGRKVITIGGKRVPPPPRKVVIERLAPLPSKPQSVIIERWLPYTQGKRRVILQRAGSDPVTMKPRNVVVQWEAPSVSVKKEIKYLGVIRANPAEYVSQYGASLKVSRDLPQFVLDIATPNGLVLAANAKALGLYELEGDVAALQLVDLDREGLGEYRAYLQSLNLSAGAGAALLSGAGSSASFGGASSFGSASSFGGASVSVSGAGASGSAAVIEDIFRSIDVNASGKISVAEASKAIFSLNSRLGRSYGDADIQAFFRTLDVNGDGKLDFQEFRQAFFRLL